MNGRQSKARREAEAQTFRTDVMALVEAQKAVIGALVRHIDTMQKDIEDLKLQMADVESIAVGAESAQ